MLGNNSPRRLAARGVSPNLLPVISAIADGVDEGGFALLDLFDGALERRFEIIGIFEGAFGIPAHGFRQAGEVGIGIVEIHADMRARRIRAAGFG